MKVKILLASFLPLLVFCVVSSKSVSQKQADKQDHSDELSINANYRIDMEKYIKEKEKTSAIDYSITKDSGHTVYVIKSYDGNVIEHIPINASGYPQGYSVEVNQATSKTGERDENIEHGMDTMETFLKKAKLTGQSLNQLVDTSTNNYSEYNIDSSHAIVVNKDNLENKIYLDLGFSYVLN